MASSHHDIHVRQLMLLLDAVIEQTSPPGQSASTLHLVDVVVEHEPQRGGLVEARTLLAPLHLFFTASAVQSEWQEL